MPAEIPLAIPLAAPIVATEALPLVHTPPDGVLLSREVPAMQIAREPVIAAGDGLTVTYIVVVSTSAPSATLTRKVSRPE